MDPLRGIIWHKRCYRYRHYGAPDFAGNPANIIRTVHVQELPELSLSSESYTISISYGSFHIETVQIDGSTYALVASNQ